MIDGLRRIAAAADTAGVRLGLEPIHASQRDDLTLITTIPETLALLDEAGLPDVGIMIDLWHVGDTPGSSAIWPRTSTGSRASTLPNGALPAATIARCPASAARS